MELFRHLSRSHSHFMLRTCLLFVRAMAVLKPLKVTITNLPGDAPTSIQVPNFPVNESKGFHSVSFRKTLYIEQSDFKEVITFKGNNFELWSLMVAHPFKFYISLKSFFSVCDWAGSTSE